MNGKEIDKLLCFQVPDVGFYSLDADKEWKRTICRIATDFTVSHIYEGKCGAEDRRCMCF